MVIGTTFVRNTLRSLLFHTNNSGHLVVGDSEPVRIINTALGSIRLDSDSVQKDLCGLYNISECLVFFHNLLRLHFCM